MVHETIQGTFRQTNLTNESADYLAKRIILIDDVGGATSAIPGSPPITQIAFPACRAHYPGGPDRWNPRLRRYRQAAGFLLGSPRSVWLWQRQLAS